jgi:hypothetical protein
MMQEERIQKLAFEYKQAGKRSRERWAGQFLEDI